MGGKTLLLNDKQNYKNHAGIILGGDCERFAHFFSQNLIEIS